MSEFPWEKPDVREELRMISLYLPETSKFKLKWLSEHTGVPQQKILRGILLPELDAQVQEKIKKLGLEEKSKETV